MKRKLFSNKEADARMITLVIGIMITLAISVLIFYNIMGSLDTTNIDSDFTTGDSLNNTPAGNATDELLDQAEVFYTLAPLIAIVIVAVVIIGYVSKI